MGWNYGPPMWGFWFVFPVMGFVFMIVIMVVVFQFFRGRGAMCGFRKEDEFESLRKEIRELRADIETLKKQTKEIKL